MTDQTSNDGDTRKLEDTSMTATNALTPIANTNELQQHIGFDQRQPLQLSVTNASGQIRVSGSTREGIWLVVRRTDGKADEPGASIPITVSIDGNSISIHPDWTVAGGLASLAKKIKDQLQNGFDASEWDLNALRLTTDLNYDMRVELPLDLAEGSKVSVKTASGAITLNGINAAVSTVTASGAVSGSGLTGIISANSASGAISLEAVNGSLEVNAVSGAVSVRGGEAWTALRTVSGRIRINDFTMKHGRIATVSGAVEAHVSANNAQSYTFSTVSGRVELDVAVPAGVTSSLTSKSASGSVSVDGDWVPLERRSWKMGSGETGPAFDVKTVSGALHSSGRIDGGLLALREPLPEFEQQQEAERNEASTHDQATKHMNPHDGERGMWSEGHLDMDLDSITTWAKDFAKDFKRNFSQLGTPPEPLEPDQPTSAVPPAPPVTPPTPPRAPGSNDNAPWTWSSTTGATTVPPVSAQQPTSPITPVPPADPIADTDTTDTAPADVPVTPEPANTADVAAETGTMSESDAEHLRVLEALERGDIDVDEALSRLDPGTARGS